MNITRIIKVVLLLFLCLPQYLLKAGAVGETGAGGGNCSGAIVSEYYNIDSYDTCGLDRIHDHFFTNPLLGPLADNGGPTWTQAISPSSPAIDAGDCSDGNISDDQRYIERPQGAACDIGAYEFRDAFQFLVFLPIVSWAHLVGHAK